MPSQTSSTNIWHANKRFRTGKKENEQMHGVWGAGSNCFAQFCAGGIFSRPWHWLTFLLEVWLVCCVDLHFLWLTRWHSFDSGFMTFITMLFYPTLVRPRPIGLNIPFNTFQHCWIWTRLGTLLNDHKRVWVPCWMIINAFGYPVEWWFWRMLNVFHQSLIAIQHSYSKVVFNNIRWCWILFTGA